MRLFIAIDLPGPARLAIAGERNRIRQQLGESSGTWMGLEQMHVTLVFIGEADDARAGVIADVIGAGFERLPFRLAFGGLGTFPPHGPLKVLWVGTLDGTAEAIELQREVVSRLVPAGVPPETRPFHPHVTLARWKSGKSPRRDRLTARSGVLAEVEVEAVTLYHSRLSSSGPTYTALSRGRLTCR